MILSEIHKKIEEYEKEMGVSPNCVFFGQEKFVELCEYLGFKTVPIPEKTGIKKVLGIDFIVSNFQLDEFSLYIFRKKSKKDDQ